MTTLGVCLKKLSFQLFFFKLTHYNPGLIFYTPWKHQKIIRFIDVFKRYRKATRDCNELKHYQMYTSDYTQLLKTGFCFFLQKYKIFGKLVNLWVWFQMVNVNSIQKESFAYVLQNRCSQRFRKIHRKAAVSIFNESCRPLTLHIFFTKHLWATKSAYNHD